MTPAILLAATVSVAVPDAEPLHLTWEWRARLEDGQSLVWWQVPTFRREDDDIYCGKVCEPLSEGAFAYVAGNERITPEPFAARQSPGAGATAAFRSQATSAAASIAMIDWTAPACTCRHKEPPEEPTPAVPLPASWAALIGALALLTRLR